MDFLSEKNVMLGQHADDRYEVLRAIANAAESLGVTHSADAVYRSFLEREEMGATGMTDGFAIPHAKCAAINTATVIVFKNDKKLSWPSFDDKPIDIAIALLVPDGEAGTTHIKLLSKTAVLLMDDGFKELVRDTNNAIGIARVINKELEKSE
ncbi:MAG: fructose PTS transporter subunit IIA [Olegusella sp.]|nr:fructose PTS transporter subunit IIA [Olegusella sp.]